MTKVLDTVRKAIKRHHLLTDSSLVLVAVSGGSDSVFLLRALCALKDEFGITLMAAHLNHMLRGEEAARDAEWVKDLCDGLAVDCTVGSRNVRSYSSRNRRSLEESARECRYEFLENLRAEVGADTIALGHTMEDQAETLLLRLFRGSGATGLSAMAVRRGFLIRPLLELRRHDIKKYLDENGFEYLDDPTNLDLGFRRNLMRHRIVPSLESQLSGSIVPILARTASVLAEEDAFLEETAEHDLADIGTMTEYGLRLESGPFSRLDQARKRRLLRAAVRKLKGDLRGIGYVHIDALLQLLSSGSAGSRIDIPTMKAYRDYDHLLLSRKTAVSDAGYLRILKVPGVTFVREASLRLDSSIYSPTDGEVDYSERNKAYFDLDELTLPISVRNRRPGDRFVPFAAAESKKLKEVFIDDKVSRRLRDSTPIVVDSEGILWIPGGRRSDRAPVTGATERILCIEARKDPD
jgi:tRNA(Ile)-lysidine synthase